MDYRMEHKEHQQFLALVRAFPNEISSDDNDHSIPDFWTECSEKNLIGPMQALRPEGKRDLYGLCSPLKNSETHFNYGIGIMLDEDTDQKELERFIKNGYSIWKTEPVDYAVFKCFGTDGNCLGETWSKFSMNLFPRQVICKQMIQIMKSILTEGRAVCFVSCGFLLRKIERLRIRLSKS